MSSLWDPTELISGPGWFKDIFHVEIECEGEGIETEAMPEAFQEVLAAVSVSAPVVNISTGTLRGNVLLIPPPGRKTVNHSGVTLTLFSTVSAIDQLNRPEHVMGEQTFVLCEGDVVPEEKRIPFEFELPKGLVEPFTGKCFWVRHEVRYSVSRPWYTFPISGRQIVCLLNRDCELEKAKSDMPGFVEVTVGGVTYKLITATCSFPVGATIKAMVEVTPADGAKPEQAAISAQLVRREEFDQGEVDVAVREVVVRDALLLTAKGSSQKEEVSFKLLASVDDRGTTTMMPVSVPITPFTVKGKEEPGTFCAQYVLKLKVKQPHREPVLSVPLHLRLVAAGAAIPDYSLAADGSTASSQPSGAA